ncbi:MAG: hypothetical protein KJ063_23285 [Anaerolineae bacterium]|nr:hypothetical protein [Anaerolineae bacterium]
MLRHNQWLSLSLVILLLLSTVIPAAAAPAYREPVLLPDWLGAGLVVLSLILAASVSFWMRNQKK